MKMALLSLGKKWDSRPLFRFWKDAKGIGTLEVVLIAGVLILVAILFKDWIMAFIEDLMSAAEDKGRSIFED
mgnify:CR=1 FL=1